ncbi:MAG: archaeal heat shock protein Hsp20 [Candidatus Hodarchaeales archaeon]|jgi:HSP20 family protein
MPSPTGDNYDEDERPQRRRRRNENPFDDFIKHFMNQIGAGFDFEDIFATMDYFMEDFLRRFSFNSPKGDSGKPPGFVWGFRMTSGPDGRPRIERFGNTPQKISSGKGKYRPSPEREPLIDVIEDNDVIRVIAEIPGVQKQNIDLSSTDKSLLIQAESEDLRRKYYKELELPCTVIPDSASAKFKNGVLEVELKKDECLEQSGTKVSIK